MANVETSRPAPFGAISTFRIVNVVDTLRGNIISAYNAYKTEKALNALSNAQLEDIGIARADISAVVLRAK